MVPWVVGAMSMAGFVAAWVLAAGNRDLPDIANDFGPDRFLVAYAVAGTILAARRPANPVGWLLLGVGVVTSARGLAGEYARHALAAPPHPAVAVWAAWFVGWSLTLLFPGGLLTFLLLLFPNGRLLSARWRVVAWLAAGLGVVYLLLDWFDPGPVSVVGLPGVSNPTGLRGWIHMSRNSPIGSGAWILG